MMSNSSPFKQSPCVGRCSTVYGDPICRGCKRFINEVSFWNQITLSEKTGIWSRLDAMATRVVPQYVDLINAAQLEAFLNNNAIRYPFHLSTLSWALHCIENFPFDLGRLSEAGLVTKDPLLITLKQLRLCLQRGMYELSLAEKSRHQQIPVVMQE